MDDTRYTLSDDDLATINAARSIVKARFSLMPQTEVDGMLYALAETWGDSTFRLLNWAKHNGGIAISDDVLHNREPVEAA